MQSQEDTISYILKESILDEQTLQSLLKQQQESGQSLINILKQSDLVDSEQLVRIVAVSNKIEFVNLSPDMVDTMAAHMVSYEMANQYNIIPVKKDGNKLIVAMGDPLNLSVRDQLELRTGCMIVPVAATPNAIRQAVRYHFNIQNLARQTIASMRLKEDSSKDRLGSFI